MTPSVTFPEPILTADKLDAHILAFLRAHPSGVRNADVGRAIGYNDTRQWFSYGILERLIAAGKVRKVQGTRTLYFSVA